MSTLTASPTWYTTPTLPLLAELRRGGLRVPYPLAQAFGGTVGEVERLRSTLVGRGVAVPPAAADLVGLIARATVAVDLRWSPLTRPAHGGAAEVVELGAVGLLAQDRAAVVCATGANARVALVPAHAALSVLLSCLPALGGVPTAALAYPQALAADLDALALRDQPAPNDAALLRRLGTSAPRLRDALRALRSPTATGQLGVTFDGPGAGRRGPHTIGLFDSPAGRAMVTTSRHGDDEPWITITPAGPAQLLRAAAGLLAQ